MTEILHIIGGGLAGSEAAWKAAQSGIKVKLYEMRPEQMTPAHQTNLLAELVCSNSFRSDDPLNNAVGLLHAEMRIANSLIMEKADQNKIPAGSALAVDREGFSNDITTSLENHPNIEIIREEITDIHHHDWQSVIIATGPLTSNRLSSNLSQYTKEDGLAFFDAIAPILYKDSIDFSKAWYQSRYDKSDPEGNGADYINCALNQSEYESFVTKLRESEKTEFKSWEKNTPYFEGCLPIEVMAERGIETLRYGPLKPVGLVNMHKPETKPYAVVQLRQDNKFGSLYNMVGFQTKLKYSAQKEIFQAIPGLEQARFARFGSIHRNTFINSPKLLDHSLRLKKNPHIRFAGQITGVEGYIESAAIGLIAGYLASAEIKGNPISLPPNTSACGALIHHIIQGHYSGTKNKFQPMNINLGLFPPLNIQTHNLKKGTKKERNIQKRQLILKRGLKDFQNWHKTPSV